MKQPLVATFRPPLMMPPDRSVETLNCNFSVTFIKSINYSSIKLCLNIQTPSQNISNFSSSQTLLISVVHNDFNFLFISKCLYSFEKKRQQQQNLLSAPILNDIFTERHHFRCLLYREEILLIPAKKFITPIKFFRFTIRKNYITLEISGVVTFFFRNRVGYAFSLKGLQQFFNEGSKRQSI